MAVNVQGWGATSKIKINGERPKEKMNLKSRVSKILCADIPFVENSGNGLSNKFTNMDDGVVTIVGDTLWKYFYDTDEWISYNLISIFGSDGWTNVYGGSLCSINDEYVVIIGGGNTTSSTSSTKVQRLRYYNNTWSSIGYLKDLPYDAKQPLVVYYKGRIHSIGGGSTVHYAYDEDSRTWNAMATLPFSSTVTKHSIQNGLLYVTVGSTNYVYDGSSWNTYSGVLPESHGYVITSYGNMHEMLYDAHIVHRTIYYDSTTIDDGCGDSVVAIPSNSESILPMKQSLSATSWSDISRISKLGKAREYFDYSSWNEYNGPSSTQTKDGYYIVGFDHDRVTDPDSYGREYAGITFMRKSSVANNSDSYATSYNKYRMLDSVTSSHSYNSWANSYMRNVILQKAYYEKFSFKNYIVPVYKEYVDSISIVTVSGEYSSHNQLIGLSKDTVFLPSLDEILTKNNPEKAPITAYCGPEGSAYEYIYIHDWDNSSNYNSVQWTRSRTFNENFPRSDSAYCMYHVYHYANADADNPIANADFNISWEENVSSTAYADTCYIQPMFCI